MYAASQPKLQTGLTVRSPSALEASEAEKLRIKVYFPKPISPAAGGNQQSVKSVTSARVETKPSPFGSEQKLENSAANTLREVFSATASATILSSHILAENEVESSDVPATTVQPPPTFISNTENSHGMLSKPRNKRKGEKPMRSMAPLNDLHQRIVSHYVKLNFGEQSSRIDESPSRQSIVSESLAESPNSSSDISMGEYASDSSGLSYLDNLASFYRNRNDGYKVSMKKRHDEIMSRSATDKMPAGAKRIRQLDFEMANNIAIRTYAESLHLPRKQRRAPKVKAAVKPNSTSGESPRKTSSKPSVKPTDDSNTELPTKVELPVQSSVEIDYGLLDEEDVEFCKKHQITSDQFTFARDKIINAHEEYGFFPKTSARRYIKGVENSLLVELHQYLEDLNVISK